MPAQCPRALNTNVERRDSHYNPTLVYPLSVYPTAPLTIMQATPTIGMHPPNRGIPAAYVHPSAPPSRSTLPTRSQDGWAEPPSQLMSSAPPFGAAVQAPPAEARSKNQHKPDRRSRLDEIPEDQMQKFKLRAPVQMDRIRREQAQEVRSTFTFTAPYEANGASGSRAKARQSSSEKKEKTRVRLKDYRDDLGAASSELFTETYGHEEDSRRPNHTRPECVQDAAHLLRALKRENAALQETVRRLEQRKDRRPWEI